MWRKSKRAEINRKSKSGKKTTQKGKFKPHQNPMSHPSELAEKIEQAKIILESDLQNPPSLTQLGHLVGLNETYLKVHFKAIHQITVYGFIKRLRMERAKALLMEGKMNISEIALEVGYKYPTHFTAAFKKAEGKSPKEYQNHK